MVSLLPRHLLPEDDAEEVVVDVVTVPLLTSLLSILDLGLKGLKKVPAPEKQTRNFAPVF